MRKIMILAIIAAYCLLPAVMLFTEESNTVNPANEQTTNTIKKQSDVAAFGKYLGAGLAVACATMGSGIAVGRIGAAAMGAISENPNATGTAMVLTALAEGICLWGIAGAFLILVL